MGLRASDLLLSHSLRCAATTAPDNCAVRCGDDELSYRELVDRVARFAATLVDAGVVPGDRVAVHAAKSVDAVVAMHGAQWAGAVSVPVDPAAPPALVADVLTDAAPSVIVTDQRTAARLPELPDLDLVHLGHGEPALSWSDVAASPAIDPVVVDGDAPAYIIYTSGSTGKPKGIVHSHASGLAYARLAAATYELTAADRLANVAPFHFDQSTFELYAAPVAAATTVLVPEVLLRFPAEVSKLLAAEQVTVWYSVPTILVHLLERGALDHHDISSLRWVLFGGEVFPSEALASLMQRVPAAVFSNVYGPAELNHCTHHHLEGPPAAGASIPIGLPWSGAEVRLRAADSSLVTGPGEGTLEVSAITAMLGYWNRPDLTAAAFRVELDEVGVERRWYLTGDVCRRDEAGLLHFRGRSDRQVKIRGNRVELEAVEAALSDVDGVLRAAVVVVDRDGERSLVAVVEGVDTDGGAVLAAARRALPPYAVPADAVVVPALPRTTSGKIDPRAAVTLAEQHLGLATTGEAR